MLNFCRIVILMLIAVIPTGCATILAGKTQTVALNTNPPGARCELIREGRVIGTVESTPGAVMLHKTKHDIDVECRKDGHINSKGFAESGTEGATYGNIILGGLIGWGIDSAVGADNKYPEVITVNLVPLVSSPSPVAPLSPRPATRTISQSEKPKEPSDLEKRVARVKKLRDDGLLTEEEYQKKRAELINQL